jgi:hypothetical protein
MGWQDELNSLDQELSAGRIQADEYRRRRDELLATASSNSVEVRRVHRKQGPSIANAFAGNGDPKPGDNAADITQRVGVPQEPAKAAGWQTMQPPPPPPPPGRAPAEPQGALSQIFPSAQAPMQGSEVFSQDTATSKKWPRYVIAIVVLALVAGLTWFLAFRPGDSGSSAAPPPSSEPAPAPAPVTDTLSIEKLPNPTDLPLSTSGILTVDQAQLYNMIKPDEASYLVDSGTEKILCRAVTSGNLSYVLFAFQVKGERGGEDLAAKIIDRNKNLGMTDAGITGLPSGVTALTVVGEKATLSEAVYGNGRVTVRIVIQQTSPGDRGQLNNAIRRSVDLTAKSIAVK